MGGILPPLHNIHTFFSCMALYYFNLNWCRSTDTTSHSWTPEEVYNEVIIVEQCLEMRETLFQTKAEWDVKRDKWLYSPIISLDFPTVKRELKGFIKTIDFLDKSE